jgi:hypothetical protein
MARVLADAEADDITLRHSPAADVEWVLADIAPTWIKGLPATC